MPMKSIWSSPTVRFDREELRERLDPVQFNVTQERGTERCERCHVLYIKIKETVAPNCPTRHTILLWEGKNSELPWLAARVPVDNTISLDCT